MSRNLSPVVPFFRNPLLQRFLQDPDNRELCERVLREEREGERQELERRFADFCFEMRFLGFVRKHIHYEALHVLRKSRTRRESERLVLNGPMSGEEGQGGERLDLLADERVSVEREVIAQSETWAEALAELAADPLLHEALQGLTPKQQQVLDLLYVRQLTEQEAAEMLGVSQQSVNKLKKHSLNRIRRRLGGAAMERRVQGG